MNGRRPATDLGVQPAAQHVAAGGRRRPARPCSAARWSARPTRSGNATTSPGASVRGVAAGLREAVVAAPHPVAAAVEQDELLQPLVQGAHAGHGRGLVDHQLERRLAARRGAAPGRAPRAPIISSVHGPPATGSGAAPGRRCRGRASAAAAAGGGVGVATRGQRGHHAAPAPASRCGAGRSADGRRRRRPSPAGEQRDAQPAAAAQDGERARPARPAAAASRRGGQRADRVQHAHGTLVAARSGPRPARHAAPRGTAHWAPVTSLPDRPAGAGPATGDAIVDWYADRRPRPAVAPAGRRRLGGAGQRGDAAADPGGAGRAGLAGVAGPLAHPGRPRRRSPGRGHPRLGQARLPAPGAAAARGRRRPIVERHGGVVPADVAALEALPGIGTYTARAVACFGYGQRAAGRRHQRPPGGRPAGARPGRGRRTPAPPTWPTSRPDARPTPTRAVAVLGGGHGARARWSAWPAPRAAAPARCATGAPGGWPAPRRTTGRPGGCRSSPAPTGRCAAGCSTSSGRPTSRSTAAALDAGLGRRRPALPLPGLAARPTAWSSRPTTASSRLPGLTVTA